MNPLIGVLLNKRILRKHLRGTSTFENLSLYVKAANELDVNVIFFDPSGVRATRQQIIGYMPTDDGSLERTRMPFPRVVHKRGLFFRREDLNILRRLTNHQVYMFNPEIPWDKYRIHEILSKEPRLLPYLPEAVLPHQTQFQWFRRQLTGGSEVFVKSRRGSLGLGIARVWRTRSGDYRYETRRTRKKLSLKAAWNLIRKRKKGSFMQAGIALMEDQGRRVDFRVPVQRDGNNRWNVAGIAAKRAEKLTFLTNLARGASVHDGQDMLTRNFGEERAAKIMEEMVHVADLTAQTVNARYPKMVDLGLDIGVNTQGQPYLIEVNRRDLRILLKQSGQPTVFETLYKNPMAYAKYVLQTLPGTDDIRFRKRPDNFSGQLFPTQH